MTHAAPTRQRKRDSASLERRLKAAGLDTDNEPQSIDEFRLRLARKINMILNQWHGCRELLCRRHRGCMAPNIVCSNVERLTPEEVERDWPEVQADIYNSIKAVIAERGLEDG